MKSNTYIRVSKVIVKLSHGCITACELCKDWQAELVDFSRTEIDKIKIHLLKLFDILDLDFLDAVTFYWGDVINSKYLLELIEFVNSSTCKKLDYYINCPNLIPYNKDFLLSLVVLNKKFNIIPVFVRNIKDIKLRENMSDWLKVFTFLQLYPYLFSPFSIRYYQNEIEKINEIKIISKKFPEIDFAFWQHPISDYTNKQFITEKLWTQDCKYFSYALFDNDVIHFTHPENEINLMLWGDITMHTNICYLSKYRYITNIFQSEDKIKSDISIFYSNLESVNKNSISLSHSCYKCIYWY